MKHQDRRRTSPRILRRAGSIALLALAGACGSNADNGAGNDVTTPAQQDITATEQPGAESSAPSPETEAPAGTDAPAPTDAAPQTDPPVETIAAPVDEQSALSGQPAVSSEGWPESLVLPTVVDPAGTPLPGTYVMVSKEVGDDVSTFVFHQAAGTAPASAFSGVGTWATTNLTPLDGATDCTKDMFWAAISAGVAACSGATSDGRQADVSTAFFGPPPSGAFVVLTVTLSNS